MYQKQLKPTADSLLKDKNAGSTRPKKKEMTTKINK